MRERERTFKRERVIQEREGGGEIPNQEKKPQQINNEQTSSPKLINRENVFFRIFQCKKEGGKCTTLLQPQSLIGLRGHLGCFQYLYSDLVWFGLVWFGWFWVGFKENNKKNNNNGRKGGGEGQWEEVNQHLLKPWGYSKQLPHNLLPVGRN